MQALLEDAAYERAEEVMRRVVDRFRWPAGTRKVAQYLLGPARYEPVAYLGAQWPELDQFMRAHLSA